MNNVGTMSEHLLEHYIVVQNYNQFYPSITLH